MLQIFEGTTKALPQADAAPITPHPVYGRVPEGFELENQIIQMLNFWHEKAVNLSIEYDEKYDNAESDPVYRQICESKLAIFEAAFSARIKGGAAVAVLLEIVSRHVGEYGAEVISIKKLHRISEIATAATVPPEPTKHVGALTRGRKLTRAGLLYRYHAFLVGELETVSWFLYGSRDYGKFMVPRDRAVNQRCRPSARRCYPFFNEAKLPDRARAVMRSLKIDTTRNDDVERKGK